jgi:hypothetical protein
LSESSRYFLTQEFGADKMSGFEVEQNG